MNAQDTLLYTTWGWAGTIVGALAIVAFALILAHVLTRLIGRALNTVTGGRISGSIVTNIMRVSVWVMAIALLLNLCVGIDPAPLWGALGVGGIALSLGAQSTISNLLGGLQVTLSRETSIGDWVVIGTTEGEVRDITWRKMIVADEAGNIHNIPNATLINSTVTVLTKHFTVSIPLVLSEDCDLSQVEEELPGVVAKALVEAGMQYADKRPLLVVQGTQVAGITCTLRCFAYRTFTTGQVTQVATDAALSYLRAQAAFASYDR